MDPGRRLSIEGSAREGRPQRPHSEAAMGLSPTSHDEEFEMVSHMTDASKRLGEDKLPLSTKMNKRMMRVP